jgi:hypothetical protein
MKTIWKYRLNENLENKVISVPQGAEFLSVQKQGESLCLWYLVNPEALKEERKISIVGTGHTLPESFHGVYLGTVQYAEGSLIWHIFDISYLPNDL